MEKNKINIFLDTYCILVSENEDSSITELMMDDHKCINYEDTEYYVPENNMLWDANDHLIYEHLILNYSL